MLERQGEGREESVKREERSGEEEKEEAVHRDNLRGLHLADKVRGAH